MSVKISRRHALSGAATLLAAPLAAPLATPAIAQAPRVLKFIPAADLAITDPYWTTAYITRNHAMMVFDTLYGMDAAGTPSPQMLEGHRIEDDGKTWLMTLREGLKFHDGTPVLARDAVASLKRWGARDNFGQTVLAVTDELSAVDDRTLRFRLKRPFPLLPAALGKGGSSVAAIMPERLAGADATKPITEVVGSGPFRFVPGERVTGARVTYARNDAYVPRASGTPSFTAGPKIAHFDRVEWHIIPDPSTAGAALQNGEMDWWENPTADLVPRLRANRNLSVSVQDEGGLLGFLRLNHLQPPFNNPAIRRALLGAISQDDYMIAATGDDPALRRSGLGFFAPGSPMASDAGMEALNSPRDLAQVKRNLAAAGYKGEKVVVLIPTDIPTLRAFGDVGADMFTRAGFNTDPIYSDWGTLVQRVGKTEPVEQGGWSAYHSAWSALDQFDPAVNTSLRAPGRVGGRSGWPASPQLESLREQWLQAPDLASQKRIAREIQLQAFQDVPYIPTGQLFAPTAYRNNLTSLLTGYALFWNIRRV